MIVIKETPYGVTFSVKVQPRAHRNAITGTVGNSVKLSLTAPPVEGKANAAVIDFLADLFDIYRSSVTIASGQTHRLKLICVSGLGAEEIRRRLGAAMTA